MGGVIFWLISTTVSGLVIGGIGRLLVPARKLVGLGRPYSAVSLALFFGGLIAHTVFGGGRNHWLLAVTIEVLAAAALVAVLAQRRRPAGRKPP